MIDPHLATAEIRKLDKDAMQQALDALEGHLHADARRVGVSRCHCLTCDRSRQAITALKERLG